MNLNFLNLNKKQQQGLIVVIIGFTLIGIVGSQYFAYKTNYNHTLKPIFRRIYNPYSVFFWIFKYKNTAPRLTNLVITIMNFIAIIYSFIIYFIIIKLSLKNTHGSATFSKDSELIKLNVLHKKPKAGETYPHGIVLGKTASEKIIIDSLATHDLVIAPTRSGKGVGIILPTLVTWKDSVICFDVKGENFNQSSKYRQKKLGNYILKLSPCDPLGTTKYNPLSEIRIKTSMEIKDIEVIANILVSEGNGEKKDHFQIAATTVFTTIILHLLYTKDNATMGDIYDFLTSPNGTIEEKFTRLLETKYMSDKNIIRTIYKDSIYEDGIHPNVVQGASEILAKSERERASVISTAINRILLFRDPIVRKNTSDSDFKLSDILDADKPVSLYFCAEIEDMDRLGVYIRIVLTMFMNISMRKEAHKYKCLMLLDEFPLYGKLDTIESALGVIASYGIKIMLIAQNKEQIEKKYGKVNTIKQGCASTVFYAPNPNDFDTQKLISDILGNKTITYKTSSGKKIGGLFEGNISVNKKARKLLEPDEVVRVLGEDKTIVLLQGANPTMGIKIRYFTDRYYDEKIVSKDNKYNPNYWAKIDIIPQNRRR